MTPDAANTCHQGGYSAGSSDSTPPLVSASTTVFFTYLALLVVFGVVGNLFSIRLLLDTGRSRYRSVTQYLVGLAVGDIWMLIVIGLENLHATTGLQMPAIWGYCQWQMYSTYVCCFFSAWLIVAFTAERALVVRNPFLARRLSKRRARIVLATIAGVTVVVNAWAPMMIERGCVEMTTLGETGAAPLNVSISSPLSPTSPSAQINSPHNESTKQITYMCMPVEGLDDNNLFTALTVLDLIFSCLLPTCALFALNCYIGASLHTATIRRRALRNTVDRLQMSSQPPSLSVAPRKVHSLAEPSQTPRPPTTRRYKLSAPAQHTPLHISRTIDYLSAPNCRQRSYRCAKSTNGLGRVEERFSGSNDDVISSIQLLDRQHISVQLPIPSLTARRQGSSSVAQPLAARLSTPSSTQHTDNVSGDGISLSRLEAPGRVSRGTSNSSEQQSLPSRKLTRPDDRRQSQTASEDTNITRLLLTVSLAYLLLNLPSYTIRVVGVLTPMAHSQLTFVVERLCYMLFYSQFAVNFLLYSVRLRVRRRSSSSGRRRRRPYSLRLTDRACDRRLRVAGRIGECSSASRRGAVDPSKAEDQRPE